MADDDDNKMDNNLTKLKKFAIAMLKSLIQIAIFLCIGILVLYTAKIGQANILPTLFNCKPFTSKDISIENSSVPINFTTHDGAKYAEFVNFNILDNFKNSIISFFSKYRKESTWAFSKYTINVLLLVAEKAYTLYGAWANLINTYLNETTIVLLGPILFLLMSLLVMPLWSFGTFVWYYFSQIPTLFTKYNEHSKHWEDVSMLFQPIDYIVSWCLVFAAILLFFIGLGVVPLVVACVVIMALFLPFTMKGVMDTKGKSSGSFPYSLKNIFVDFFKYKKKIIMYMILFFLISNSFVELGNIGGIISIGIALLFVFFTSITSQTKPTFSVNIGEMGNIYKQIKKTCV